MGPYFRKLRIVYNKVLEDTAHLEGQCIEVRSMIQKRNLIKDVVAM